MDPIDLASVLDTSSGDAPSFLSDAPSIIPSFLPELASVPGELTEEEQLKVSKILKSDIRNAEEYLQPLSTERIDLYNAYRGKTYGNERKGRSHYVSSDVHDVVESILPNLLKIFLSGDRVLSIVGRKSEDIESATIMEEVVDWQLSVYNQSFLLFYMWFKEALLYPVAYVETGWDKVVEPTKKPYMSAQEYRNIAADPNYEIYSARRVGRSISGVKDPQTGEDLLSAYEAEAGWADVYYGKIIKNCNAAVCFHPAEFLIEKGATDIQKANFVGRKYIKTFSYFKERERSQENPAGIYINLDKLEATLGKKKKEITDQTSEEEKRRSAKENELNWSEEDKAEQDIEDKGRQEVEVVKCWPLLDVKGKGISKRYLIEFANGIIIRAEYLPFNHGEVPVAELKSNIDPHQLAGICSASEATQLQKLNTAVMRQIIDNLSFANNGFAKVKRGSNVDLNAILNPKPRGFVLVDEMDDFQYVTPSFVGDKALAFLEFLSSKKEEKTGVTRYNQGLDADTLNKTARGITQIMAASQQRIETIARIFAETGVMTLMRHFIENNMQFMDKNQTIRLVNKDVNYDPSMMQFKYDLIVNVGIGTGNKQQQIQDATMLLQTILADPVLAQSGMVTAEERYNAYETLLQAMGRKDIARYIKKPEDATPPAPPEPPPQAGAEQPPPEGMSPEMMGGPPQEMMGGSPQGMPPEMMGGPPGA